MCNEPDKKVIGLHCRGMSVDSVRAKIGELYESDISATMISKITDQIMDTDITCKIGL